jgi:glucose/arabinose dehydrogenase
MPFGEVADSGRTVEGAVPCSGAVLRMRPAGSDLQLVAWGFRNPFGLAFAPDGRLLVTDNGYDDRGSRPVWGTGDYLWTVEAEAPPVWHGWPDFAGGVPISEFAPPGEAAPQPVLAELPNAPPAPAALLGVHSSSNGLDVSTSDTFGHAGDAFVAQFGDMAPGTGKALAPVGFRVVRVDPSTGVVTSFAANEGETNGPASKVGGGGLERPIAARFSPDGEALYVVDFGVMTTGEGGVDPRPHTGVLWRITREEEAP